MRSLVDFLVNSDLMSLAADPRVIFAAAALFVVAIIFKWKSVMLLIFAMAAIIAVLHYSKVAEGQVEIGQNLYIFAGGILAIGIILIYFLFMRGD